MTPPSANRHGVARDPRAEVASRIVVAENPESAGDVHAVLREASGTALIALSRRLAERDGPIVPVLSVRCEDRGAARTST